MAAGTTPPWRRSSKSALRSHGGLTEQRVPFLVSRPVDGLPAGHRLRNFDAYWVALNHVAKAASVPVSQI